MDEILDDWEFRSMNPLRWFTAWGFRQILRAWGPFAALLWLIVWCIALFGCTFFLIPWAFLKIFGS